MTEQDRALLFEDCIQITAKFEGATFSTVTGNFDGMGMSCGILQWNIGSGTLRDFILSKADLSLAKFPKPIDPLLSKDNAKALEWFKSVAIDEVGKLKPDWRAAFSNFMKSAEVVALQKLAARKYFTRAEVIAKFFELDKSSLHHMAWAYDWAVQAWSIQIENPRPLISHAETILQLYDLHNYAIWSAIPMSETMARMVIASHLRALKCNPRWKNAFFLRKCSLALGDGIVNGERVNLSRYFTAC